MPKNSNQAVDKWVIFSFIFVGCIIVSSGLGRMLGDVSNWSTIGTGAGFVIGALFLVLRR